MSSDVVDAQPRSAAFGAWLSAAPMVEVINVHKSFGQTSVLAGVNLSVRQGEVVCIIGPSGSGKSTLLRLINHLESPDRGLVRVAGEIIGYEVVNDRLRERSEQDIARQRSQIGMVFQEFNLFSHLTALENVALGPIRVLRTPAGVARDEARTLLSRVGLRHRLHAYPASLSGGEQQRVSIARALALRPAVMLFDEPTSALDPERVDEVLEVIKSLAASGMTMIIVTHEIAFARDVAETVVFIDGGTVVEAGPCRSILTNPHHERTREFLKRVE